MSEAEENIISCLLTDGKSIENVYSMISPEMFEEAVYGRIYLEYRNAFDENRELTLSELKQSLSDFTEYEVEDAVRRAVMAGALPYQIQGHANAVCNHYKRTCVERVLERVELKDGEIDSELDRLIKTLDSLRDGGGGTASTVSEITARYKDNYFKDTSRPKAVLNIESMDEMIGGLEGGDLVLIGARPAVGKSALATEWSERLSALGLKVGYYNLEMQEKSMYERFIAAKSGIEITRIRLAKNFVGDEKERYAKGVEELMKQDRIFITTGAKKVSEIRQDVRAMGYNIIIVDYLQLLIADDRYQGNRQAEVGEISRQLKAIAMDFDIPVIALSQLNRASEGRAGKEPTMGELREAGNLEQDASVIILMWNKDETDRSRKGLKVEKSRQGKTGRCDMVFDGAHMSFQVEDDITPFGE